MGVKCIGKFQCNMLSQINANKELHIARLSAVCTDDTSENERFHKYTPSGTIEIYVDNPSVRFELGKYYRVEFSETS